MLDIDAYDQMNAFCQAVYQLLAAPDADFDEWGLVVAGGRQLTEEKLAKLCGTAARTKTDIIYLEFGERIQHGPEQIRIIVPGPQECRVYDKCEFWAEDAERPLKLVQRVSRSSHFAAEGGELILLPYEVSPSMGPGLRRAKDRLRRVSRGCRGRLEGAFVIHFDKCNDSSQRMDG